MIHLEILLFRDKILGFPIDEEYINKSMKEARQYLNALIKHNISMLLLKGSNIWLFFYRYILNKFDNISHGRTNTIDLVQLRFMPVSCAYFGGDTSNL